MKPENNTKTGEQETNHAFVRSRSNVRLCPDLYIKNAGMHFRGITFRVERRGR